MTWGINIKNASAKVKGVRWKKDSEGFRKGLAACNIPK
jgi:hypothetical protein